MAKRWYIVHAYSNFEKKVADSIREQSVQKGLGDLFEQVLVPTEEVVEVRRGRKIKSERRFFPGYVLVKMELTDQAFHLIKNTPKVTGSPRYDAARKALTIPVQLEPGSSYRFSLNSGEKRGFQSEDGVALEPVEVRFATRAAK